MIPLIYFPFATNPAPAAMRTTLKCDPCPMCGHEEAVIEDSLQICAKCLRSRAHATAVRNSRAQRDSNGSLLCQQCQNPFPHAEPDAHGQFVCYGCRNGH